jgi:hypothetical protein
MGIEYQLRFAAPDAAGAADILRRFPAAVERPDGFDFRARPDPADWPDATAFVNADGIWFCDYLGGEGRRLLGELVAKLAGYGPVTVEEM